MENTIWISLLILIVAFLYSSVGHGGASGYLAIMAVCGVAVAIMKPTALILNIFVSLVAFILFYKSGYFRWNLFWPFIIGSIPASFAGGLVTLDDSIFKKTLAIILIFPILRLFGLFGKNNQTELKKINIPLAIVIGAAIGFLSGMMGIGGGIILSPVLLLFYWANMKETAAVSALFIFVNSISGLLGYISKNEIQFTSDIILFIVAGLLGGFLGSYIGSKKLNIVQLRISLAIVLTIACFKLIIA